MRLSEIAESTDRFKSEFKSVKINGCKSASGEIGATQLRRSETFLGNIFPHNILDTRCPPAEWPASTIGPSFTLLDRKVIHRAISSVI